MGRKKSLRAQTGAGSVSFNMTPMIDLVFNLIIFFILTAQFQKLEIEEVTLPMSITAQAKETSKYKNIIINVKNPDRPEIVVFGRVLTPDELTEVLKDRKASIGTEETMNVILRADAMVPYEDVARVMLSAGRAQIQGWWITTEIEKDKDAKKP